LKEIIIRTSERRDFKRCQQRWSWAWRHGLKPKRENNKLWFGSGIHVALAEWYLKGTDRGPHPAKTWMKWVGEEQTYIKTYGLTPDENEWIEARELGALMLLNYTDTYGEDLDWNVIATEQTFQAKVEIPDVPNGFIIYTGTFDGVYRLPDGTLWLMEHKTASSLPQTGFLELDDQAGSYFLMAEIVLRHQGLIGPDEKLDGIMYNFLRKAKPDDRPVNEFGQYLNKNGSVSKVQGSPLFMRYPVWRNDRQRDMQRQHIVAEARQMWEIRQSHLQVTKTPTKDCSWDCSFYQMCQLHESGDDWEEFRNSAFVKRDPYSDHRLELKSASM
jgi:hypothetical protein